MSLYDLTLKNWNNHIEFEEDVASMFKVKRNKNRGGSVSVLLKNGAIYTGILTYEVY